MGNDYAIGDDPFETGSDYAIGDDELGAAVKKAIQRRGLPVSQKNVHAAVKALAGGRPTISESLSATEPGGATQGRIQKASLDSVATIAAGATQVVTCRPQKRFRAERFTISPGSTNWLVNSIQIGVDPQFVTTSGSVGGGEYDPLATSGANLMGGTADPGIDIAVSVTNTTGGALRFTASFTGPSL